MPTFAQVLNTLWPDGDRKVPGLRAGIAAAAPSIFAKYGLTSNLLIAHAMAQFSHECGAGLEMVENIHYTAERAVQVWPSRFSSAADCYAKVGSWSGDPDFPGKLIDSVYGRRMGNRVGTHDGRNFIGRGLPQTTGRDGYAAITAKIGVDFLTNPDWVNKPEYALEVGVADFIICGCLPFAKADDVTGVTRRLNGGTVGLAERQAWLARWKKALVGVKIVAATAAANAIVSDEPKIPRGALTEKADGTSAPDTSTPPPVATKVVATRSVAGGGAVIVAAGQLAKEITGSANDVATQVSTISDQAGQIVEVSKKIISVPKPGFWFGLLHYLTSPTFVITAVILIAAAWFLVWYWQNTHKTQLA